MIVNNNQFETERLYYRPIIANDITVLHPMYTNPHVMKYIYDGSLFSKKTSVDRVNGFDRHWHQHGFGMWLLINKDTQETIGYSGFRYFEDSLDELNEQIELGYIIDQPYWGKGYAKEAIKACVEVGFKHYQFQRILATILPENHASQKIAIHAGLNHTFDVVLDGILHYIYEANVILP